MRFTTFLVSGALAAVAIAQSTTTTANAPDSSAQACLNQCKSGDVTCQAHCITVPSPDSQNIENTHKCVAACPQGKGSPAETEKYSNCIQDCIKQNYYVTGEGTPNATGGSGGNGGSGSGSPSGTAATATGSGASPTKSSSNSGSGSGSKTSSSGTQTGTGAATTSTGAAAGFAIGSSGAFVGAVAALLAL
ncbi:hypothetical protein NOR_01900 [Metarhizium rileyi]|uniref:Uncharacterized protein n=1 Tax=Metarhizium rileyi (strain RCEF 4871) TaxID=1649241 RepID=A0A162M149_METRR|nr:hypothetical protein NOR_01900 [Metarhizium rileyi RCEF 4871]